MSTQVEDEAAKAERQRIQLLVGRCKHGELQSWTEVDGWVQPQPACKNSGCVGGLRFAPGVPPAVRRQEPPSDPAYDPAQSAGANPGALPPMEGAFAIVNGPENRPPRAPALALPLEIRDGWCPQHSPSPGARLVSDGQGGLEYVKPALKTPGLDQRPRARKTQ